MRSHLREFGSLTENMQEKVYDLLVEKYALQGRDNPGALAWKKIKGQQPMKYRAWQRLNFFSMQTIDKCLREKGLPAKHFPTTQAKRAFV